MYDELFLDWDEGEIRNRPQDTEDDWIGNCMTEEAHRRMLERVSREYQEAKKGATK